MDNFDRERLKEATVKFPIGCTVHRKPNVKPNQYNRLETAVVKEVVMTGIHCDIFIKTGQFCTQYLDADSYEVQTADMEH